MKILYVAPLASIHSKRWVSYFEGIGHDVHAVDASFDEAHEIPGVTVHYIPLRGTSIPFIKYIIRYPRWLHDWRRVIDTIDPDIIHIHWLGLHALGATLSSGGRPTIITPWGSDLLINPDESIKWRYQLKRIIATGDLFICDADHLRDALIIRGVPSEKIHVIAFGTDVARFEPSKRDQHLAKELGFPDNSPLVVSLRSLDKIYDIGTLLRAIPLVIRSNPRIRFIVVGDGPERLELKKEADALGINNFVKFVGRLPDDQMVRYTASASAYVSTSLSDGGLAAATAEAMSCAIPPVITEFGDNATWVENGVTGYLFPCGDHIALAQHLNTIFTDNVIANNIGRNARQTILERNNVVVEMGRVDRLYETAKARTT